MGAMIVRNEKSLGYFTEFFVKRLVKSFYSLSKEYSKIGIDLVKILPVPFNNLENMYVGVNYYKSTGRIEFFFREEKGYFSYSVVENDDYRAYLFEKEDEGRGVIYNRAEPRFDGKTNNYAIKIVSFGMNFSFQSFVYRLNNTDELALEVIKTYVGSHLYYLEGGNENYLLYLKNTANDFLHLIMDDNTPELVIDDFLENNNIILKEGLGLEKLIHQVTLKNIIGELPHDLKPDVIGYNIRDKRWEIVDYKKTNKKIMKNVNKTRTGLTSQVHSLRDQLKDYYKYFEEKSHRDFFNKKYNTDIRYPCTIGVVGTLEKSLENDFNRLLEDEPRWFKIIPYNYLYDNFMKYINTVESINGGDVFGMDIN